MAKAQHGRKPQKPWHRRGEGYRFAEATERWPAVEAPHDGTPIPHRQGHVKGNQPRRRDG